MLRWHSSSYTWLYFNALLYHLLTVSHTFVRLSMTVNPFSSLITSPQCTAFIYLFHFPVTYSYWNVESICNSCGIVSCKTVYCTGQGKFGSQLRDNIRAALSAFDYIPKNITVEDKGGKRINKGRYLEEVLFVMTEYRLRMICSHVMAGKLFPLCDTKVLKLR